MLEAKWITFENCEVFKAYQELPLFLGHYSIELHKKKDNSIFYDTFNVNIDDSKLFNELLKLKNGEIERCQFACGMADIDIYKNKNNNYVIHDSPSAGIHYQYIISPEEFEKLLSRLDVKHLDLYLSQLV